MNRTKRSLKRRRKLQIMRGCLTGIGILLLIALAVFFIKTREPRNSAEKNTAAESENNNNDTSKVHSSEITRDPVLYKLETFAEENHFSVDAYPEELIALLRKNSETEEFVLNYPLEN